MIRMLLCLGLVACGAPSPEPVEASKAPPAPVEPPKPEPAKDVLRLTDTQAAFCKALTGAADTYARGKNDLQRSRARGIRKEMMAEALPLPGQLWAGTISTLTTTSKGQAIVRFSLEGCPDYSIGTANTEMTDLLRGETTLIAQDSPLFDQLAELEVGQPVFFLFDPVDDPQDIDVMAETSMTEQGSMAGAAFVAEVLEVYPRIGSWAVMGAGLTMQPKTGQISALWLLTGEEAGIAVLAPATDAPVHLSGVRLQSTHKPHPSADGDIHVGRISEEALAILQSGQPFQVTVGDWTEEIPPVPAEWRSRLKAAPPAGVDEE